MPELPPPPHRVAPAASGLPVDGQRGAGRYGTAGTETGRYIRGQLDAGFLTRPVADPEFPVLSMETDADAAGQE